MQKTKPAIKSEIIRLYNEGKNQAAIALASGVNQSTVSRIIKAAKSAGLILARAENDGLRHMSDKQFSELYSDPRNHSIFRKEASKRQDRSPDAEDAIQQAWVKIMTMKDGHKRSFYLQAGIWAIRDFYRIQTRHCIKR
ncbi:MAG: helix-turn-helix domain-containing protein [Spirochaetia bacterium]|nr:helix-turn-helix domain-containing protein [Spirochaetia bacterium]